MDIIIVKTIEDMERITKWSYEFLRASSAPLDEEIEFRVPFRHGQIQFLFEGCSLDFESDENINVVRFKLYAHPAYMKADWAKKFASNTADRELLGGFTLTLAPFKISDKWFNMSGRFINRAQEYEEKHNLFAGYTYQWFTIMMLALHYRPEFESNCQSREAHSAGRKKGKKVKRVKTLYTRTYVITGDITDKLPKPVKRHTKPDHEFSVRGHFRQYKSGKRVWVNPHIRCKGRKPSEGSIYIAKIAGGETHDNS